MAGLKNYCYSLIIISVIATIIMLLAPNNGKTTKYLQWICALCITGYMIAPILKLTGKIEFNLSNPDTESVYIENGNALILNEFESVLCDTVKDLVYDRFDVKCKNIEVHIINDDIESISLESISIDVDTESNFLKADVKRYLNEKLSCEINFYD